MTTNEDCNNAISTNTANLKHTKSNSFPYDYICVIDFEATCKKDEGIDYQKEIIEFPIVVVSVETNKIEDSFREYVKPVINPKLSEFCTELTGITQEQVDAAEAFPEVLRKVNDWFTQKEFGTKYKFVIATDGPCDCQYFLNLQCQLSNIEYPYWATSWIDIRQLFTDFVGARKSSVKTMIRHLGLEFEGHLHSGLDDSRNIARILINLRERGCKPRINCQIKDCLSPIQKNPFKNNDDSNNE